MTQPEQTVQVLEHSLAEFIFAIDELRRDGWEFYPQDPPNTFGFAYIANLWRNPTDIQREAGPKQTREEILAKARAALAAKRAAAKAEDASAADVPDESPY